VSVKHRWVGSHEQVLISCWRYGPSKPCSLLSIEAWLFPTTSMAVMREKLDMDLQVGQPACCGLRWEPFFSGTVDQFNSVDDYVKGCYVRTA
jgi:hypothetical protein